MLEGSRVALVHDFLVDVRGAERVFLTLCDLFPQADVFTAVYDEDGTEGRFAGREVHTSYLQKLHPTRAVLPRAAAAVPRCDGGPGSQRLRPRAVELQRMGPRRDPRPGAMHVCYCHNPFRYAWNARSETLSARGALSRAALGLVFQRWRQWDYIAAQRVDAYVANWHTTQERIARYFGRESTVLHPPVEIGRFTPGTPGEEHDPPS